MNILVFAYVYPPDAGSGTFRTLYFTNHWARLGDAVTVVTVQEECFLESALVDHGLCAQIHPAVNVVRASVRRPLQKLLALRSILSHRKLSRQSSGDLETSSSGTLASRNGLRWIKDTITDLLSCPDEHVGWISDAVRQASRVVESTRVDCVYASGGPWSTLLAARCLHEQYSIPLVLDFRDPWISNPNLNLRTPISRWIQEQMESKCIAAASLVVANTEELRQDFVRRYPRIPQERFITVTNGFESMPRLSDVDGDRFTLVHAGALYQSRNPLNFLRAVAEIVTNGEIPKDALKVRLVGGISISDPAIEGEIRSPALRNVLEILPRVPHAEALALQCSASVLLLIQTGFPLQVPRKVYEYLSLGRPILAIAEADGATARMVRELHGGCVVDNKIEAIKEAILNLYQNWKAGRKTSFNEEMLRRYSNQCLATRLREAMQGLCA